MHFSQGLPLATLLLLSLTSATPLSSTRNTNAISARHVTAARPAAAPFRAPNSKRSAQAKGLPATKRQDSSIDSLMSLLSGSSDGSKKVRRHLQDGEGVDSAGTEGSIEPDSSASDGAEKVRRHHLRRRSPQDPEASPGNGQIEYEIAMDEGTNISPDGQDKVRRHRLRRRSPQDPEASPGLEELNYENAMEQAETQYQTPPPYNGGP